MSLGDHLRELRRRVVVCAFAIILCSLVGWFSYDWLLAQLQAPLVELAEEKGALITLNFGAALTDALASRITVSLFTGILIASPVWLYQLWAFIVPGLTKKEKRVTLAFVGSAVPLFLAGCYAAFLTVPRAVEFFIGFTPKDGSNITDATIYLSFILKFMLAFGMAFLLPVFMVALNVIGVASAKAMLHAWRPATMGLFVFAAIMTPTQDPYTMLLLGTPMILLYFVAVGVAWIIDRRRAKTAPDWLAVPDEEASAL